MPMRGRRRTIEGEGDSEDEEGFLDDDDDADEDEEEEEDEAGQEEVAGDGDGKDESVADSFKGPKWWLNPPTAQYSPGSGLEGLNSFRPVPKGQPGHDGKELRYYQVLGRWCSIYAMEEKLDVEVTMTWASHRDGSLQLEHAKVERFLAFVCGQPPRGHGGHSRDAHKGDTVVAQAPGFCQRYC